MRTYKKKKAKFCRGGKKRLVKGGKTNETDNNNTINPNLMGALNNAGGALGGITSGIQTVMEGDSPAEKAMGVGQGIAGIGSMIPGPIGTIVSAAGGLVTAGSGIVHAKEMKEEQEDAANLAAKRQLESESQKVLMNYDTKGTGMITYGQKGGRFANGGNLTPISNNSMQVQANNPNAVDSVDMGDHMLDHDETVNRTPNGNDVYSDDMNIPGTNISFANANKKIQKQKKMLTASQARSMGFPIAKKTKGLTEFANPQYGEYNNKLDQEAKRLFVMQELQKAPMNKLMAVEQAVVTNGEDESGQIVRPQENSEGGVMFRKGGQQEDQDHQQATLYSRDFTGKNVSDEALRYAGFNKQNPQLSQALYNRHIVTDPLSGKEMPYINIKEKLQTMDPEYFGGLSGMRKYAGMSRTAIRNKIAPQIEKQLLDYGSQMNQWAAQNPNQNVYTSEQSPYYQPEYQEILNATEEVENSTPGTTSEYTSSRSNNLLDAAIGNRAGATLQEQVVPEVQSFQKGGKYINLEDTPIKNLPSREEFTKDWLNEIDSRVKEKRISRRKTLIGESADLGFPGLTSLKTCANETCDTYNTVAKKYNMKPLASKNGDPIMGNSIFAEYLNSGKYPFTRANQKHDMGLLFFKPRFTKSGKFIGSPHSVTSLPVHKGSLDQEYYNSSGQGDPVEIRKLPKPASLKNKLYFNLNLPPEEIQSWANKPSMKSIYPFGDINQQVESTDLANRDLTTIPAELKAPEASAPFNTLSPVEVPADPNPIKQDLRLANIESRRNAREDEYVQPNFAELYGPSLAKMFMTPPIVPSPSFEKMMQLQRIRPDARIAELNSAAQSQRRLAERNTVNPNVLFGQQRAIFSRAAQERNRIMAAVDQANAAIQAQQANLNVGIGNRNNNLLNNMKQQEVERQLAIQRNRINALTETRNLSLANKRDVNQRLLDEKRAEILQKGFTSGASERAGVWDYD